VLAAINATVAASLATPPDAARLAALKQRLKYGFLMGLQTPESVAARLAQYIALTGDLDGVRTLYATYAVVTPEDVQRAAQTYFVAAHRTVGVLRSRQ